mmetsp:Transcript_17583/g.31804  ORF Transcript_17583/g.31804 Transcript_17583/m.31804 type:complete len:85 (+) Transcript_17583:329-583(+)
MSQPFPPFVDTSHTDKIPFRHGLRHGNRNVSGGMWRVESQMFEEGEGVASGSEIETNASTGRTTTPKHAGRAAGISKIAGDGAA